MVAISLSGSGEGLGRAIARGYSTGNDGRGCCGDAVRTLIPAPRGRGDRLRGNDVTGTLAVIPAKAGTHDFG